MNTLYTYPNLAKYADIRRVNLIQYLKYTKIDLSQSVIMGSSVLSLFGIRENDDIDIIVTNRLWNRMSSQFGKTYILDRVDPGRESSTFFYHKDYKDITFFKSFYPLHVNLDRELKLKNSQVYFKYGEYKFQTLEHLTIWKTEMGRPKDMKDVRVINGFLKNTII
jgi:hypothetical protein